MLFRNIFSAIRKRSMKSKIVDILKVPKFDSLRIEIPFELVEIIDKSILSHHVKLLVNTDTGEIENEVDIKQKSKDIKFDFFDIKVTIVERFDFKLKTNVKIFNILLHSKINEADYFSGITHFNIEQAYKKLMSKNMFKVSFEDFLNGKPYDIDVAKDVLFENHNEFKELTKELSKLSKESKSTDKGFHRFENGNIQFNKRERSTLNRPFLKLYYKYEEAFNRKTEFFENYFTENDIKGIVRIEATLKLKSDCEKFFNTKDLTLIKLLNIEAEKLHSFIEHSLTSNLKTIKKRIVKSKVTMSPADTTSYLLLTLLIDKYESFDLSMEALLEHYDSRMTKKRIKEKMTQIYEDTISKGNVVSLTTKRQNLLEKIGLRFELEKM
jgi:hypothetical protein